MDEARPGDERPLNDLAQLALGVLVAARVRIVTHPLTAFGVGGFALGWAVVVAGGWAGPAAASRPLTSWLGLQRSRSAQHVAVPAAALVVALVALVVLWLTVVAWIRRSPQPTAGVWRVAAAWALPFVIGPPLMDTGVYSSVAFGLLQRAGHDPYDAGPSRLGTAAVVSAIDPSARGTRSAAGPLGTALQHLAVSVSAGSALGGVLLLRAVAVLATVYLGRLAVDLAGLRGDRALTLTVLNPLVLLYCVSAAHPDALMSALVLGALVMARRRRWLLAVLFGCLAGSVLPNGFVVVPFLVVARWFPGTGRPGSDGTGGRQWLRAAGDALGALALTIGLGLAVRHGSGWLGTVFGQFSTHTVYSVAGLVSGVLTPIVPGASYDDLAIGGRIATVTAMVCVVGYLLGTARHRPLDRNVGYALLAIALLAPVLYPWYLLWGVLCLAPTAAGARLLTVLALSVLGCALTPPGFSHTVATAVTGVLVALIASALVVVLARARRGGAFPPSHT